MARAMAFFWTLCFLTFVAADDDLDPQKCLMYDHGCTIVAESVGRLCKSIRCEIGAEEIYKYMTDSLQKWKSTGSADPLPEYVPSVRSPVVRCCAVRRESHARRDSSLKHAFNTTVNENWQNYGAEFRAAALDLLDLEDYEDMLSPTFAGVTKTADIKPAMVSLAP